MAWVTSKPVDGEDDLAEWAAIDRLILEARILTFHQLRAFRKRCPRMTETPSGETI
jgi:hypothetical protein